MSVLDYNVKCFGNEGLQGQKISAHGNVQRFEW